jgi:hypothetical protein
MKNIILKASGFSAGLMLLCNIAFADGFPAGMEPPEYRPPEEKIKLRPPMTVPSECCSQVDYRQDRAPYSQMLGSSLYPRNINYLTYLKPNWPEQTREAIRQRAGEINRPVEDVFDEFVHAVHFKINGDRIEAQQAIQRVCMYRVSPFHGNHPVPSQVFMNNKEIDSADHRGVIQDFLNGSKSNDVGFSDIQKKSDDYHRTLTKIAASERKVIVRVIYGMPPFDSRIEPSGNTNPVLPYRLPSPPTGY